MATDCLFCKIVSKEVPAERVHNDGMIIGIRDINPQAPYHILLMPREHIPSAGNLTEAHALMLGRIYAIAGDIARRQEMHGGYRLVTNVGPDGGQSVEHLHIHMLAGRQMSWPPG
jgi:histidine triad (HIT) family protein